MICRRARKPAGAFIDALGVETDNGLRTWGEQAKRRERPDAHDGWHCYTTVSLLLQAFLRGGEAWQQALRYKGLEFPQFIVGAHVPSQMRGRAGASCLQPWNADDAETAVCGVIHVGSGCRQSSGSRNNVNESPLAKTDRLRMVISGSGWLS